MAFVALVLIACSPARNRPSIEVTPPRSTADGESLVTARFSPPDGHLELFASRHSASLERQEPGIAYIRVGVTPAEVVVRVGSAKASFTTVLQESDSYGDGTPDYLRLPPEDQSAFRRWFTYLAEAQYFRDPQTLSAEINDCAALIRYAYREALSEHSTAWANQLGLAVVPSLPSIRKYTYPFTPAGAGLFHAGQGQFVQFADARTLQEQNCHFVSRDIRRALPGDILFYRQISVTARHPFHSMVFLGDSQIEPNGKSYVVYHTGDSKGIRRLTVDELIGYPLAQWRPLPGNGNFLGVYRWNILR